MFHVHVNVYNTEWVRLVDIISRESAGLLQGSCSSVVIGRRQLRSEAFGSISSGCPGIFFYQFVSTPPVLTTSCP